MTIFAGGNDTNAIGTAVDRGAAGGDPNGYIDRQVQGFASDYAALVRGVRARAPSARIVAMNLPNMAALPYAAGFTLTQRRYLQRISVGFSEGANALVAEGVVVVDLMCDPRSYERRHVLGRRLPPERRWIRLPRKRAGARDSDGRLSATARGLRVHEERGVGQTTGGWAWAAGAWRLGDGATGGQRRRHRVAPSKSARVVPALLPNA